MTEKYKEWADWKNIQQEPIRNLELTRTQYELAEYILNNEELCKMLQHPGDKLTVIENIQKYLKK